MSERVLFGKIEEPIEPPNLIEIQLQSYVEFLQQDKAPSKRNDGGLQAVFKEVFPITSYDEKVTLDFVKYEVGEPKLTTSNPSVMARLTARHSTSGSISQTRLAQRKSASTWGSSLL